MQNRAISVFFPNKIVNKILSFLLIVVATHISCAPALKKEFPEKIVTPTHPWSIQEYSEFLKENMSYRDEIYSTEYVSYDFLVDTGDGPTLIQNLIDPDAVSSIVENLDLNDMRHEEKILYIYKYVLREYAFHVVPHQWETVEETVKTKKGDCKNLSLLLMSLLLS
ncbi:MAG: hypothetical protein MUO88_19115, partial [Desulfobacterales bacterium]|nr:hypothetical protein [Desulfobacterales bacterium]